MRRFFCSYIVALALVAAPGCASSGTTLATTTSAAHVAVLSVHVLIDAERQAFAAGAYDLEHHALYVDGLLKLAQSELVLNDALQTWNASQGQPMPTIVADAIFSLGVITSDLTPLVATNSAIAPFLQTIATSVTTLKGGQ